MKAVFVHDHAFPMYRSEYYESSGFDEKFIINKHNFRQADALEYAKNGTLEQFLDKIYKE